MIGEVGGESSLSGVLWTPLGWVRRSRDIWRNGDLWTSERLLKGDFWTSTRPLGGQWVATKFKQKLNIIMKKKIFQKHNINMKNNFSFLFGYYKIFKGLATPPRALSRRETEGCHSLRRSTTVTCSSTELTGRRHILHTKKTSIGAVHLCNTGLYLELNCLAFFHDKF